MFASCSTLPVTPLPLDNVDPSAAYKLMDKDALPDHVKELIASVESAVDNHYTNHKRAVTQDVADEDTFCQYHNNLISQSQNPKDLKNMWILQRDISVQLFQVMIGLVRNAGDLARRHREHERDLPVSREFVEDIDLELAFHGGARGGYQWLNCIAKDECDWVWASIIGEEKSLNSHCPACLLGRAIDSESTIRLLIAAASLYKWQFFVSSLQQHLLSDPWWGPGYWESIAPKAVALESQVKELLTQCVTLRQNLIERSRSIQRTTRPRYAVSQNRAVSQGHSLRAQQSLSPRMKIDFDALHSFLNLQLPPTPSTQSNKELLRYQNRYAANYQLAVYCWFALVMGLSSGNPQSALTPVVRDLLWKSKVKSRSKTV